MSRFTIHPVRFRSLAAALLLIGTAVPGAWAAKGGGGGTGGGTIYFINGAPEPCNWTWSMNSDGSTITKLGYWAHLMYPSRTLHNGHRWFVTARTIPDSYYPDGATLRREVFAYRDDYDPGLTGTEVQLTDDATLQPTPGSGFYGMQWLPGDEGISFKARRWSGDGHVIEGGLYIADLEWDGDGDIIRLAALPAMALEFPLDENGWPGFGSHSWDPAGNRVVYTAVDGLWVFDLARNTYAQIVAGSAGYPDWSPDGSKILFTLASSICTIKPDGTGLKKVISPTYVGGVYCSGFGHGYFSPAGDYIVCVGCTSYNGTSDNDLFRATSSGRSLTNLTKTKSLVEIPIGWR